MRDCLFYPIGVNPACQYAVQYLKKNGIPFADSLSPNISHLLLDIPSTHCNELLNLALPSLSRSVIIIGGMLPSDCLFSKIDLLDDPFYLSENALITAECALHVAFQELPCTLRNAEILIIGWGRIGKQLARLLSAGGANVTICSRSVSHQAEIFSSGLSFLTEKNVSKHLSKFRVIFNTAPDILIEKEIPSSVLKIELASKLGLKGDNIVRASGLPGRLAPESSGQLIARTILRILKEDAL